MEGKLSAEGHLYILRNRSMKLTECPYNDDRVCGDWCPLFGEAGEKDAGGYYLTVCQKTLMFTNFTDNRV